jgi:hypothetical protein
VTLSHIYTPLYTLHRIDAVDTIYLCFPANLPSPYANGFVNCFSPRRVCVTPPDRHAGFPAASSSNCRRFAAAVAAEAA